MSFSVCHSYSEIVSLSPCCGSPHRSSEKTLLVSKPNLPFGYVRNSDFQVCNHDVRKSVMCSNLVPQRLNGFYLGNKQLEEPSSKLNFVKTLLIDNYDSYTYNIYQELSVINGIPPVVVRNDEWTWEDACYYLYEKKAFHNIVISPGPGSPTCANDIGICLQLLLKCKDIPILGVCLGHQALGYVHGACVVHAPEPVHGRLSEIEHTGCRLFQDIPSGKNSGFKVVRYHSLVVDSESLPRDLLPIAWTLDTDTQKSDCIPGDFGSKIIPQNDEDMFSTKSENGIPQRKWTSFHSSGMESRVLMGIMHSTRPHYGLQFHPESIATCHGRQIFNNFREMTVDYWLRSSSSSMRKQKAHHAACMQVAFPQSNQSVNGLVEWSQVKTYNAIDSLIPSLSAKFLRLSWKKFDHLAAKVGGARNIFCELFGQQKAEDTFWLDSSSTEKRRARFSFMGGRGGSLWKQLTFRLSGQSDNKCGGYLSVEDAQGFINTAFLPDGFFDFLKKELRSFCYIEKEYEGLPFDFHGGYIGYIGYDLKAECSMASNCHRSTVPDACLFFVDHLVVVDHYSDDVYILSLHDGRTSGTSWLDAIERKLLSLNVSTSEKLTSQPLNSEMFSSGHSGFRTDRSREQYMEDIKKCLSFIRDGESYELCLTTQMRKRVGNIDTLELYLNLREQNPAPYAAWLNFSKENISICCSSPERFLQLDRYGNLEAKPIKGTIARGLTQEEDEQFKLQLQYSEKDRAENLMIVDLLRNDLGRVCEPGSVHVPRLMEVESYTTVHTMVSTIRGKKLLGISPVDCVKAAFPGGSMTGAPKLRSMELLDSLETCSRGIYSGCIGFFSYDQTFDLNIVIRTVVIHEGEATIGAGGAIVALSDPQAEYDEMILKTQAPTSAVVGYQNRVNLKSSS